MNKIQKRELSVVACLILVCFLIAYLGYIFGVRNTKNTTKEVELQIKVDNLKVDLKTSQEKQKKLADSLSKNTNIRLEKAELIDAVIKTIKNEINKTSTHFKGMPNSDIKQYVDSIRRTTGFY